MTPRDPASAPAPVSQPPRAGHRGYISPRPARGARAPQHVQNLVIRDHCARHGLSFRLSVVEYVMPGCHIILQQTLEELPRLEGVVAYTLFMMPERRERRRAIYDAVLASGATLHFAVEGLVLAHAGDIAELEDIWGVQHALDLMSADRARGASPRLP